MNSTPARSLFVFEIPWFGIQVSAASPSSRFCVAVWAQCQPLGSILLEWFFPLTLDVTALSREDHRLADEFADKLFAGEL